MIAACEGASEADIAGTRAPLRTGAPAVLHAGLLRHHHRAHTCPAHPGVDTETCGWTSYDDGLSGTSADFVFFDERARGVAYALSAGFIWRSSDGGESFSPLADVGARVTTLRGHGPDPSELVAATIDGLVTSADAGATWQKLALGGLTVTQLDSSVVQPQRQVMVVDYDGPMLTSSDSGEHWGTLGVNYPRGSTFALTVDPRSPLQLLTMVQDFEENSVFGTGRSTVFRTQDGGLTWHKVHSPPETTWTLTRCPANPDVVLAGSRAEVWRTNDNGATWTSSPILRGNGVTHIAINPHDCNDYYALQEGVGPLHTRDGGNSFGPPLTVGLDLSHFGSFPGALAIDPQNPSHLILATHAAFFASHDSGEHWSRLPAMMHMNVFGLAASPRDPAQLWLATWGQGAWQRDAAAAPWTLVGLDRLGTDYVTGIHFDPTRERVIVGANPGQLSLDGEHFTPIPVEGQTLDAAFDPVDPSLIYISTQVQGIFKSSDGGASWQASNTGIEPWPTPQGTFTDVRAIVLDPDHPQQLFAATLGGGIYRSDDAAAHWTKVLDTPEPATCMILVPGSPVRLYACLSGITASLDGGQTWTTMNEGLESLVTRALVHDADSGSLYLSTAGGTYRRTAGAAAWEPVDPECPMPSTGLTLMQEAGRKYLVTGSEHGIRRHAL